MFPILGRNLQSLLDYEGEDFEEHFGLDFTVSRRGTVVGVMEGKGRIERRGKGVEGREVRGEKKGGGGGGVKGRGRKGRKKPG